MTEVKLEPIWQNLPINFKINAVEKLDFKTRLNLRICSKADKAIVDASPVFLERMNIYLFGRPTNDVLVMLYENINSAAMTTVKFNGPEILKQVFKPSKLSKIDNVLFWIDYEIGEFSEKLQELVDIVEASGVKFKVNEIGWGCSLPMGNALFRILNHFEPKSLSPVDCALNMEEMEKLFEYEFWKKSLQKYRSWTRTDWVIVPNFLHLTHILLVVPMISAEDAWQVVKSFKTKPLHSEFSITITDEVLNIDLPKILEYFDVPVHNESNEHDTLHAQPIPTPFKNQVLVVNFGEKWMRGAVCGVDTMADDKLRFFLL